MALKRAHTSAKAADPENLLLLNKLRVEETQCRGVSFRLTLLCNPLNLT